MSLGNRNIIEKFHFKTNSGSFSEDIKLNSMNGMFGIDATPSELLIHLTESRWDYQIGTRALRGVTCRRCEAFSRKILPECRNASLPGVIIVRQKAFLCLSFISLSRS